MLPRVVICGWGLFDIGRGGGVVVGSSSKLRPPSRSISLGIGCFIFATNFPLPALFVRTAAEPRGGGASGAGRFVGFEANMDCNPAICSVRPGSMLSRSPTSASCVSENEGTSDKKWKSSADNSRSLLSALAAPTADTGVLLRPSRPKNRDTADGAGAGVETGG